MPSMRAIEMGQLIWRPIQIYSKSVAVTLEWHKPHSVPHSGSLRDRLFHFQVNAGFSGQKIVSKSVAVALEWHKPHSDRLFHF